MHDHKPCEHDLKFCDKCDAVFCEKCQSEWARSIGGSSGFSLGKLSEPMPLTGEWQNRCPTVGTYAKDL